MFVAMGILRIIEMIQAGRLHISVMDDFRFDAGNERGVDMLDVKDGLN